MKAIIKISFFLILFLFLTTPIYAHHKQSVLGTSTSSSEIYFPTIASGPGLILPDSPFYFLDKFKQQIRLLVAFDPKERAKIHTEIAGERLAELRIMMSKNNNKGIDIALTELENETEDASSELSDAKAKGENIDEISRKVNAAIKNQRDIIQELEVQSDGELGLRLLVTKQVIKEAKNKAEDTLSPDDLDDELNDSLEYELEDSLDDAKNSTITLERVLEKLNEQASESAKQSLKRREEALKKAIENQDKALKLKQEWLKKQEEKKNELILESQKRALEKARETNKHLNEIEDELKNSNEIENDNDESKESENHNEAEDKEED